MERLQILTGDCRKVLNTIPDRSIHCCVTSPPYWSLRDYGVAGQIGLEPTVDEWVEEMVEVFAQVRRVLRDDGTLWLNLGDSYTAGAGGEPQNQGKMAGSGNRIGNRSSFRRDRQSFRSMPHKSASTLPAKNLIGLPWLVAFALQADGWILRSDIIWHKPNPMPESMTDRPTKSHEYIFLFAKSRDYFYDAEAIKDPVNGNAHARSAKASEFPGQADRDENRRRPGVNPKAAANTDGCKQNASFAAAVSGLVTSRNKRSVWTVPTFAFPGSHFATFPPDLIKPCIMAGCPLDGTVLDPFGGSGTTGAVAIELGRRAILIELNPEYVKMIERRCDITPGLALG